MAAHIDLRPAGYAGTHDMALRITRQIRAEPIGVFAHLGSRSDERHLAAQHVKELRQLIEAEAADESADARDAIVELRRPRRVRADAHRAKFENPERTSALTDTLLTEKDRPRTFRANCDSDCKQGRTQQDDRNQRTDAVEDRLAKVRCRTDDAERNRCEQRLTPLALDTNVVGAAAQLRRRECDPHAVAFSQHKDMTCGLWLEQRADDYCFTILGRRGTEPRQPLENGLRRIILRDYIARIHRDAFLVANERLCVRIISERDDQDAICTTAVLECFRGRPDYRARAAHPKYGPSGRDDQQ